MLLGSIVPQRGNPMTDMSSVMDYVIKDFKYDHVKASLHASSVFALENHQGHCSDYHGFCSAMGRLLDVPTRVTYGINPFPKNSPSHCKMEAYLPPYGWVSFDVSETQIMLGKIAEPTTMDDAAKQRLSHAAKDRLLHGFRDNTWYIQTRGTDYDLEPPAPSTRRSCTIYAEKLIKQLADTDPANKEQKAFSWFTVQKYVPDREVTFPFRDFKSLDTK